MILLREMKLDDFQKLPTQFYICLSKISDHSSENQLVPDEKTKVKTSFLSLIVQEAKLPTASIKIHQYRIGTVRYLRMMSIRLYLTVSDAYE